jgi:hypothetical protein
MHVFQNLVLEIWHLSSFADGYRATEHKDPLIDAAERALFEFVDLIQPGAWIVDILPFCSTLPLAGKLELTRAISKTRRSETPIHRL